MPSSSEASEALKQYALRVDVDQEVGRTPFVRTTVCKLDQGTFARQGLPIKGAIENERRSRLDNFGTSYRYYSSRLGDYGGIPLRENKSIFPGKTPGQ